MFFLIAVFLTGQQPSGENLWALRAGGGVQGSPVEISSYLYSTANAGSHENADISSLLDGIAGGNRSLLLPLVSLLVSQGNTDLAEVYWNLHGLDLPATRNDLLDALSWFCRFEIYGEMAHNPPVPPDMEGTLHSNQCGAVCALGWMTTRADGLFHGDEIVTAADIQILSLYFTGVDPTLDYISTAAIENIFSDQTRVEP